MHRIAKQKKTQEIRYCFLTNETENLIFNCAMFPYLTHGRDKTLVLSKTMAQLNKRLLNDPVLPLPYRCFIENNC